MLAGACQPLGVQAGTDDMQGSHKSSEHGVACQSGPPSGLTARSTLEMGESGAQRASVRRSRT